MRRICGWLFPLLAIAAIPCAAQRRPVLPQIDEPHPYYFRELYLPQLTSGPSSLSWSPDSQELIYSMAGSLWRQKLNAKEAQQLTDGSGYDYQPDWSPDGKSAVYVSYQRDALELRLLDLATLKSRQLTTGGAVNVEPRWSPDGKKLVWVSTQYNKHFHIFIADVKNGALENLVRLTGENKSSLPRYYYSAYDMEINPVWTRDGKEILFVSNRGHIHGTGGFWRMKDEPNSEPREIHYEETNWKARPDFSPDGSRMVYSSYLGRQWHNLWLMSANGGDAFPISYGDWDETNARWSPDGKLIAFISNKEGSTAIQWQSIPSGGQQSLEIDTKKYLRPHGTISFADDSSFGATPLARISVTDETGRFYAPKDALVFADDGFDRSERPFERHYYYRAKFGSSEIEAPAGKLTIEISQGLETKPLTLNATVKPGENTLVHAQFLPLEFNPPKGPHWASADLHVHMNYGGTYRVKPEDLVEIGEAEGLKFTNELTVNKEQRFPDIQFLNFSDANSLASTGMQYQGNLLIQGQEFHTSYWGHRGILNLKEHLLLPGYAGYPNTAASSLYPMNADVYEMAHEQDTLVGAVHPFDEVPDPFAKPAQRITDELPADVALGKLDYMEIVGFSDHKSTAEVWYKLLNLGFKLPAGAGTDATVNYAAPIRGQAGFNRAYIWIPATLDQWPGQLKKGQTFATNGPLLDFTLGAQTLGSELKFDAPQSAIPFTAKLRSIVPIDHLEIVCNGKVAQSLKLEGRRDSADLTGILPVSESGWCLLRAWSNKAEYPVMDNYTYATSSPIYVIIGGKRAYSQKDAQYFLAWIDRTIEITSAYPDWNSSQEKEHVLKTLRDARAVYENLH